MEMYSRVEDISPELAKKYLGLSKGNRKERKGRIKIFARLIREGMFFLTHQGIAFDVHGTLIDGHHRLKAIVEANITVQCMVTYNVDPDPKVYSVIDQGVSRTFADSLKIEQRVLEPIKFLARIGKGKSISILDLDSYIETFLETSEALHEEVKKPLRSAMVYRASVRAAVLMLMIHNGDNQPVDAFRLLVSRRTQDFGDADLLHKFYDWLVHHNQRGFTDEVDYDIFLRAMLALDPNRNRLKRWPSKVNNRSDWIKAYGKYIRNLVDEDDASTVKGGVKTTLELGCV